MEQADFYRALALAVYQNPGADWLDELLTVAGDVVGALERADPFAAVDILDDPLGRVRLRLALADVSQ